MMPKLLKGCSTARFVLNQGFSWKIHEIYVGYVPIQFHDITSGKWVGTYRSKADARMRALEGLHGVVHKQFLIRLWMLYCMVITKMTKMRISLNSTKESNKLTYWLIEPILKFITGMRSGQDFWNGGGIVSLSCHSSRTTLTGRVSCAFLSGCMSNKPNHHHQQIKI